MIASTEHKLYKKKMKKGEGSILKAIRIDKGGGRGLIGGALMPIMLALMLGVPLMINVGILQGLVIMAFFGVPGLLMLVFGFRM